MARGGRCVRRASSKRGRSALRRQRRAERPLFEFAQPPAGRSGIPVFVPARMSSSRAGTNTGIPDPAPVQYGHPPTRPRRNGPLHRKAGVQRPHGASRPTRRERIVHVRIVPARRSAVAARVRSHACLSTGLASYACRVYRHSWCGRRRPGVPGIATDDVQGPLLAAGGGLQPVPPRVPGRVDRLRRRACARSPARARLRHG